jgi:hypothetical protein
VIRKGRSNEEMMEEQKIYAYSARWRGLKKWANIENENSSVLNPNFLSRVVLSFKTEIDNLPSNLTWDKL